MASGSRGFWARWEAEEDGRPVYAFRIAFGLTLAAHAAHLLWHDDARFLFDEASLLLPHAAATVRSARMGGWGLLQPVLPRRLSFTALHVALVPLGVALSAGFCFRAAVVLALLLLAPPVFADASSFFNHWYLQWLLLLLLAAMPAAADGWSVDSLVLRAWRRWRRRGSSGSGGGGGGGCELAGAASLPRWYRGALCAMMCAVYGFAALPKLELGGDWLSGAALRMWVLDRPPSVLSAPGPAGALARALGGAPPVAAAGATAALALEVVSAVVLWPRSGAEDEQPSAAATAAAAAAAAAAPAAPRPHRRARVVMRWARRGTAVALLGFHLANALLFDIGVFPLLSIALTALCLGPPTPLSSSPSSPPAAAAAALQRRHARAPRAFLLLFGLVQLALPLRHLVLPGWAPFSCWSELGYPFSWRMFGAHKRTVELRVLAVEPPRAQVGGANGEPFQTGTRGCAEDITSMVLAPLSPRQRARVATDPQLLVSAVALAAESAARAVARDRARSAASGARPPTYGDAAWCAAQRGAKLRTVQLLATMRVEFNGHEAQHAMNPYHDLAPWVLYRHRRRGGGARSCAAAGAGGGDGSKGKGSGGLAAGWWEVPPWLGGSARAPTAAQQEVRLRQHAASASAPTSEQLQRSCSCRLSPLIRQGWRAYYPQVKLGYRVYQEQPQQQQQQQQERGAGAESKD